MKFRTKILNTIVVAYDLYSITKLSEINMELSERMKLFWKLGAN